MFNVIKINEYLALDQLTSGRKPFECLERIRGYVSGALASS
jgi:hypothetical protein